MARLDFIDKMLLKHLFELGGWATTNRIADRLGIAWMTAGKHLEELHKAGYVVRGKGKSGRVYWRANT